MLNRQNLKDLYPLSPMQEGMLFHALREPESTAYFEQLSFRMAPTPSRTHISAVWDLLFRRHDILRTVFIHTNAAQPLQAVLKDAPPALHFEDLRGLSDDARERFLADWKESDRLAGFDLTKAPPVRIACFDLGDDGCEIVWSHHHILLDGWCLGILQGEFLEVHRALSAGEQPALPPTTPFSHYIKWLGAREPGAAQDYWSTYLSGYEELATLVPLAEGGAHHPAEHSFTLDAETAQRLRAISVDAGVTPSTLYHALWGLLLGRSLDRDDVVFGSVIANRPEEIPGIEGMLGLFINAVPVRTRWREADSFRDLLTRLHQDMLARRAHEYLPLAEIQAGSQVNRALFDHVVLVQSYPLDQQMVANATVEIAQVELFEHTHYPLAVSITLGETPSLQLGYDRRHLTADAVRRMERQFRDLVALVAEQPNRPIDTLPLAIAAPATVRLAEAAPAETTLVALFETAVRDHGDRVAVSCGGRDLTYRALDAAANEIAWRLLDHTALGPDDRVALIARRSELLPAAMLGIAKAGAAYVPIDPDYPADRIAFRIRDSGCRMVLRLPAPGENLPPACRDAVPADLPVLEVCGDLDGRDAPPPSPPSPGDLVYVAYTSGSTGRPKGVMIEHRNVAAFSATLDAVFGLGQRDTILALTTITFDISVLELLCSLTRGLRVVIASDAVAADPDLILAEIAARGVDVLQATPSRLRNLLDAGGAEPLNRVRVALVGGEKLPPALATLLAGYPGMTAFNVYGPTETTIWSTAQQLATAPLSIGRPLPGETVILLSRNGRPCPVGMVGEICIGGVGLGRGYLGRDDLTAERYITHLLAPGERLYRTGDLGRWREDGELEVLGRGDDQVKVRGHRIEPGEIEAALAACPGVRQAVVATRERNGELELVAWAAGESLDPAPLRDALMRQLPGYMVPGQISALEAMPLLPSGKVDRHRLPEPEIGPAPSAARPRDALETHVADLFADVLEGPAPGLFDDFFALGGHSLKATRLLARLRKAFSRDLRMADLFQEPTVAGVAARIRKALPAFADAIPRLADAESYALSHSQRRMWVLERMEPGSQAYLMPVAFRLDGAVDGDALRRTIDALAARHEALRTIFPAIDGAPRQVILPAGPVDMTVTDRSDAINSDAEAAAAMAEFFAEPFAIETSAPFRAALIRLSPTRHLLLFALHHIIADGETLAILERDLGRLYRAIADGTGQDPGPDPGDPPVRYRDFAAWQNDFLAWDGAGDGAGNKAGDSRAYWHDILSGEIPALDLGTDHPRPAIADTAGDLLTLSLDLRESNGLRRLARDRGATLFMAVSALVATLLHRRSDSDDVLLGFPVAGRTHGDLQDVAGIFVNTLVLRHRLPEGDGLAAVIDRVRRQVEGALEHQAYPFDRLVDELEIPRDPGRSPIFDVLVTLQPPVTGRLSLGSLTVTPEPVPATTSRFELAFAFTDPGDGTIGLTIEYRTSLFERRGIERLADQLRRLLAGGVADPRKPITRLPILGAEDLRVIASAASPPLAPVEDTIVSLFRRQVALTPDLPALVDGDRHLTYRALSDRADALATLLSARAETGPDRRVAVLAERTIDAYVGILGILVAGAAYVPLDPAHPDARLEALIADCAAVAVVTDGAQAQRARRLTTRPVLESGEGGTRTESPPPPTPQPDHLAYVIYTSGTSGRPKGVMVEHRAITNLARWFDWDLYGRCGTGLRHAAIAALTFDVSPHEICGSLLRGDTLYVVPEEVKRDPRLLDRFMARHRIEVLCTTPSLLTAGLDAGLWAGGCTLRVLGIGAEPLTRTLTDRLFALPHREDFAVWNLYGPTEACVECIVHQVKPGSGPAAVPIGRPIPATRVYLLDTHVQPTPIGVAGEICIAGINLARGYLGQPELTRDRFVSLPDDPTERIYRTGDLAYWRPDGSLHFIGRRDHQVKIRGYRIELAEIEHHLLRQPGVRAGVVMPWDTGDGASLACWFVPEGTPDVPALREALGTTLPAPMVPTHFVAMDALPLNANGKVDRAALPPPMIGSATQGLDPISGPTEAALHDIWVEVLGDQDGGPSSGPLSFGRRDDFFTVGGHSLKAVRIAARIRDRLAVDLPLSVLFSAPTIAKQAARVEALRPAPTAATAPPTAEPDDGLYPLTHAQRRLWALCQAGAASAYGLAAAFEIAGPLDSARFREALGALVDRHESLRTVFPVIDGTPRQRVLDATVPAVRGRDLSDAREPVAAAVADAHEIAAEPYDLATGPLLRVALWRVGSDRHVLLIAVHHIIGDAGSLDVLLHDLTALYAGDALAPLSRQARHFALEEQARLAAGGDEVARDRAYWLVKLAGELPVLDFPSDHPRPPFRDWRGETLARPLSPAVTAGLDALARAEGASLYAVTVALAKVLLHRHSGQDDIVLGSVVTGRDGADLEAQIGFYVETVALRDTVSGDASFSALLARVRRTVADAIDHRRYPFDRVVEDLALAPDRSRNPIFDVMLVYETRGAARPETGSLRVSPLALANPVSKLDLTFHVSLEEAGLHLAIEYRRDLYAADRITRLLAQFETLAADLIARGSATPVADLRLLSADDRAALTDRVSCGGRRPVASARLDSLFAERAAAMADRPAVITGDTALSYHDLDALSDRVAEFLRHHCGLHAGEPVLVRLDRTPHLIAAVLGILKAGGVYMPVDRQTPATRVTAVLNKSRCRLAIADTAPVGMTACGEVSAVRVFSADEPQRAADRYAGLEAGPDGDPPAYLIFTSGSTGEPKGVLLGHAGFLNMITCQIDTFGIGADDRVLLFASPAFDASMSELFMALLAGAALVPAPADTVADPRLFLELMDRQRVSVATLPPAYLSALGRPALAALRVLITAGEPPVDTDVRHYAPRLRYFNAYGPTESSVCASIFEVPAAGVGADTPVPIGRPLANTAIHVLDPRLAPVPIGVPGEICIAGAGLALGYVGDPAETARAFVDWNGIRLYRTGDRGWWREDGQLVYGGRLDQQLKIRGQRVEPAEIERALMAIAEVEQALVLAQGDVPSRRELVAYLATQPGAAPLSSADLRGRLAASLPAAMIPAHAVWLEAFPRTVNGKIDRAALPAPQATEDAADEAPRNSAEETLVDVFAAALSRETIGIHRNFFDEGGDSIKLLQIASALGRRGLRVEIADVYRYPTVAALADRLAAAGPAIDQAPVTGLAPLTASQAWFFREFRGNLNHFNQSVLLRARGRLDPAALDAALSALVRHHDALRLRIVRHDGRVWQEFTALGSPAPLETIDLSTTPGAAVGELMTEHANRVQRSLDLQAGHVVAAALMRDRDCDHLLLVIHHLAVDAVSWRVLLEDLETALAAARENKPADLPAKTHSVKYWTEQAALAAVSPALIEERPYWEVALAGVQSGTEAANPGPVRRRASHSAALSKVETDRILAAATGGVGVEAILLTAFARAWNHEQPDRPLVLMLEAHGREPIVDGIDVGRTVGWFTSLYPLRLDTSGLPDAPALAEVTRVLANVPNRGIGFGLLSQSVAIGRADIAFNYLGSVDAGVGSEIFEPGMASLGDPIDPDSDSLFALDILASIRGQALEVSLAHDPDWMSVDMADALLSRMADALRALATTSISVPPFPRPTIRPYRRQSREDEPLLLNQGRGRPIFAMPPLFGYGSAFRGLARLVDGTAAFHGFDFIEEDDRIARYVQAIADRRSGEPPMLLGYSGGGNLAFAVAKGLIGAGVEMGALILLDAPLKRRVLDQASDEIHDTMAANLSYFRDRMAHDADYRVYAEDPVLHALMLRKMEAFTRYLNGLIDDGSIPADIHLIRSSQDWAQREDWDGWADRTTGRFLRHQGSGEHAHMTDDGHVEINARIIAGILAGTGTPDEVD